MTTKPAGTSNIAGHTTKGRLKSSVQITCQKVKQCFEIPPVAPPTLPEEWMAHTKISSWLVSSLIVALGLYVLFLVSIYLDGSINRLQTGRGWLHSLISPAIVIYLLLLVPILRRLLSRAISTFRIMVPYNDRFKRLEAAAYSLKRRREWLALIAGTLAGWLILSRPNWQTAHYALIVYDFVRDVLIFGLLAWHIYAALARTHILTIMHGQVQELNLFKQQAPVRPIIEWTAGVVAGLVGGIIVGIFFVPDATFANSTSLILYGTFGISAILAVVFSRVPNSLLGQLRVLRAFMLFILVAIVGTIGFSQFEGWHLSDAFYATVITMTTIGYGDFSPASPEGRIFTIFFFHFLHQWL